MLTKFIGLALLYRYLIIFVSLLVAGCAEDPGPIVFTGNTMGTTYSVKVADDIDQIKADSLAELIESELEAVNASMSTYIPTSEISQFNKTPVGETVIISAPFMEMVQLSKQIHDESAGRFDPTIGPLVNLWGFGPTPIEGQEAPPAEAVEEAMARVGLDLIAIGESSLTREADTYIDLSAVAKGYGVDRVARLVEAAGASNYLVEIGGELRAKGINERGTNWTIAIERPDIMARAPYTTVALNDEAIATSGDYRNYYEIDGERYSHLIDPTTGYPIRHNLASVTVMAPTTAVADGYATAIYIMGVEDGLALAEERDLAVFAIIKSADGFESRHSTAFEAYLK